MLAGLCFLLETLEENQLPHSLLPCLPLNCSDFNWRKYLLKGLFNQIGSTWIILATFSNTSSTAFITCVKLTLSQKRIYLVSSDQDLCTFEGKHYFLAQFCLAHYPTSHIYKVTETDVNQVIWGNMAQVLSISSY